MANNDLVPQRSVRQILEILEDTLKLACENLDRCDELPCPESIEFKSEVFWNNFVSATRLVSVNATKLCMAFESEGMTSSEECQSLVNEIEKSCLALLSIFLKLPKTRGKFFHKEIRLQVCSILQRMKNLSSAVISRNNQLQQVGDVWAHCEAVEKLPKDNKDVVIKLCQQQQEMIEDASQELTTAIELQSEEEFEISLPTPPNGIQIPRVQNWTSTDRNVLFPSCGLLKAVRACIRKTKKAISERGNGNEESCIAELDRVGDIVGRSSSNADDFVLSLYPPMDNSLVREQATTMRDHSKELLSTVKNSHFYSAEDGVWVEFMGRVLDHNWVKINDCFMSD